MNKNRLEALSDGVFSIVMTLLVFEITVPVLRATPTNAELLQNLEKLAPLFISYFVSFAVLAMFWLSHNFFYGVFTRNINRTLVLLNMLYLSLIALIPFSARLIGEFDTLQVAVLVYGTNVFLIGIVATLVLHYAISSHEIDTSHVSPRLLVQARIRSFLTPFCTFIGLLFTMVNIHVALFFFAFPVFFNITPGTLDFAERILGLKF